MKICSAVVRLLHSDRETQRHVELTVAFLLVLIANGETAGLVITPLHPTSKLRSCLCTERAGFRLL
jgi:hypothetical protein